MEDNRLEKILEVKVDVGNAIKSIDSLNKSIEQQKKVQAELKQQIKELEAAEGNNTDAINEAREAYILSQQKVKDYNAQVAALSKSVQNQLKIDREQIGSMTQMRASLSNLTQQYDALSKEEREAAQGKELKDKINAVTDALKENEEATQRYYRNVGNYENAIKNSLGLNSKFANTLNQINQNGIGATLNEMSQGVKNVGKETTKLLANPIVATLALIAAAVMAVVKGIKSSEENTAKWSATMAKFKPFLDVVTVACQKFASVMLDVVGWLGKATGSIMRWLEKLPLVGDNIAAINAESERYQKIAKETYQIDVDRRKLEEESADAALRVSELRTKAKDKERYTDEQRLKFVQEANEVERKIAEEKKALAERALKAAEEEAQATQNQKEVEEELSQLRIAVKNERKAYFDKTRELLEQENTIKNEIAAKDKARADATEAENNKKLAKQEEYNKALEDAIKETEDMLIELLEEGEKKQIDIENLRHKRKLKELEEKKLEYADDLALSMEFNKQIAAEQDIHNKNLKAINDEARAAEEAARKEAKDKEEADEEAAAQRLIELQRMKLNSYASIAGSISAILDATAGDNKKRLKAAKVAALAEIAINQGLAIANAVRAVGAAVPPIPFPINVAMIASSVASAIAAIVPAIQAVNSVKLARGGHVNGPGTSTSDSVPAMLSNGEFVVNARATSMFPELLETINNLGNGIAAPVRAEQVQQMRQQTISEQSLVKALEQMPAPILTVEEYKRVAKRVDILESLTKLP